MAALDLAAKNAPQNYGIILQVADIQYGVFDPEAKSFTPGNSSPNAVQVRTTRTAASGNPAPSFLARIFGSHHSDIATIALAHRGTGPKHCVVVLDPSANGAFAASGNGSFQVPNCGVQVNSSHNRGAMTGGAANVSAKSICVVGGFQGSFSPSPETRCESVADPLASVPEPSAPNGGACSTWTANPAPNRTYCGTISITSSTSLAAGTYYFKNATVSIGSNASVTGNDVMWFFDASSRIDMNTSGMVNLSAPLSGTYKGISIFQSRSAPLNNEMKITGTSNFLLAGTLYMPRAALVLTGNSDVSVNARSGYVITNRLAYTGSSTFTVGTWGGSQAYGSATKAALVK
jgi:hypothetical protein